MSNFKTIHMTFEVDEDKLQEFWEVIGKALAIDGVYKEINAQVLESGPIEKDAWPE
jgi:hypothetical protein